MKKAFALIMAVAMLAAALSGCNSEKAKDEVKKFEGTIEKTWSEVKGDYEKLESEAAAEVDKEETVTKEEVADLVATIKADEKKLENGITKDTEEVAKEAYKAAQKLELLAKKDASAVDHEIVTLGTVAQALIKHYYGEAQEDFDTVKARVEEKLKNIEKYGEEEWNKFLDLFKK